MTLADDQHRITTTGSLHNPDGTLAEPGWATDLLLQYERAKIRAAAIRIKEWDYYCVLSDEYGAAFTVADNGYLGFVSVTILDFKEPEEQTKTIMTAFPLGSFHMPSTSKNGDVVLDRRNLSLSFRREPERRIIEVDLPSFGDRDLKGRIVLDQPPEMESMMIATPFSENPHAFYYNQKVNCMPAEGELRLGSQRLAFNAADCFGVLDWGRGVWTYSNSWYWGSASGRIDGTPFGFNIGYGFGNTSAATENMLFHNGKAHKLGGVRFHIPEPEFLQPWTFDSTDGRFEMEFVPVLDRFSDTNLLVLRSWQHQVFGRFTGTVRLDDGTLLEVKDLLGFAEKVKNRW